MKLSGSGGVVEEIVWSKFGGYGATRRAGKRLFMLMVFFGLKWSK